MKGVFIDILSLFRPFLKKDIDFISLLSVNKSFHLQKKKFLYTYSALYDSKFKDLDYLFQIPWKLNINQRSHFKDIPTWVQSLIIRENYKYPIVKGDIPSWIKQITFRNDLYFYIPYIPETIKHCLFLSSYDRVLPKGTIPNGTKRVEFNIVFCPKIEEEESIPDSVTLFSYYSSIHYNIKESYLPKNLKTLSLCYTSASFSSFYFGDIPKSVTTLILNCFYNVTIPITYKLPDNVTHLYLLKGFRSSITKEFLPRSLTHFYYTSTFKLTFDLPSSILSFGIYEELPIESPFSLIL